MKLSILTYNMARNWELAKITEFARDGGFAGIEFRAESRHKHGVELEATADERRDIRNRLQDNFLEAACIGVSSRFESPDAVKRQEIIDRTKQYIDLAADINCPRIRVFGNDMPKQGVDGGTPPDRETVLNYVADSLRELAEYAAPRGVDVLLEMHGQFNFWYFARTAVERANHPRIGMVYNCDQRDLIGGSVASTYSRVKQHIRHVHMHEFVMGYPYPELFALLRQDGYTGYLSTELGQEIPTPEEFLMMYAQLFRAWDALAQALGPQTLGAQQVAAATVATARDRRRGG